MEKIYALIDKLQELRYTGADLQTISYYTQLLQAEVLHARNRQHQQNQQIQAQSNQGQIAVIMPARQETFVTVPDPAVQTTTLPANKPEVTQTDIPAKELPVVSWEPPVTKEKVSLPEAVPPAPEPVQYHQEVPEFVQYNPPVVPDPIQYHQEVPAPVPYDPPAAPEPVQFHSEPAPIQHSPIPPAAMPQPAPAPEPLFHQPAAEKPKPAPEKPAVATLFDNIEPKTNNSPTAPSSLNERLAQQKVELGQKLSQQRIQDLKSAIGINDKYQFISELFNNDTDLYERSIKTINEFPSLQDADRWIQREIKILQGWQDDHPLVQQFYTLLRKRFS
ncbi:hypothetical protein SAMN05444266_106111 [Chitinophaga jiangningensis]|uniref:Uncharacterized protein n=1 Tax=Chitinophaga jiangningensis TaxID=1419482 RepID=A0A1M7FFI0_9BACT|nr:hypothetical protein [Chitinophaga jiangningensis]SHM02439.1 hypothetical protein SAMN05444266_106111 [Chitinophaga jiangningensis]